MHSKHSHLRRTGTAAARARASLMILLALPACSAYAQSDMVSRIAGESSTSLDLRYRAEAVNQDNTLEDARASTLRSRLTWQSPEIAGLDALLEMDNVTTIGADAYDSLIDNRYRGTHSVIADPTGTEVNQARLRFTSGDSQTVSLGRQRINHGRQRFLGGVGWRQNEQTYDALRYRFGDGPLNLDYSYLWNVNRIFDGDGRSMQPTNLDSDSHALRGSMDLRQGRLSGWLYGLDFANAPALSSRTFGLGYASEMGALDFQASWSRQWDHGDRPIDYASDHLFVELLAPAGPATVRMGYELLGSDDGRAAFATPLATLHAHQGAADMFLSTPADGLQDVYLGGDMSLLDGELSVTWHDYRADHDSRDYGSELDVSAGYPLDEHIDLQLKLAHYRSDGHAVDTTKGWLTLNVTL